MPDLGAEEWPHFVCVECGAIADNAVTLGAGEELCYGCFGEGRMNSQPEKSSVITDAKSAVSVSPSVVATVCELRLRRTASA